MSKVLTKTVINTLLNNVQSSFLLSGKEFSDEELDRILEIIILDCRTSESEPLKGLPEWIVDKDTFVDWLQKDSI